MPLPGIGVAPAAGSLYSELSAVTRRAFVPKLFVQIYFGSPTLFYMTGNAQRAAGGLNQVTVPMQGNSMVQGQFTGYGGGFNSPVITPGVQNGQFNLAYWVVPVPLPFGETVIQASDREISLLKTRMNDVYAVTRQNMARLMFTNNGSNAQYPDSFQNAFDNGTNFSTYGGINRNIAGNSAYKGQYINLGSGTFSQGTVGFTRASMAKLLAYVTDQAGGESPTFVVMNPGDYATLNADFIGTESPARRIAATAEGSPSLAWTMTGACTSWARRTERAPVPAKASRTSISRPVAFACASTSRTERSRLSAIPGL